MCRANHPFHKVEERGMVYLSICLSVIAFIAALMKVGAISVASEILETAESARRVISNPTLDEAEKERSARAASITLFRQLFSILLRFAVAIAVSLIPMLLLDLAGLVRFAESTRVAFTWQGIGLSIGLAVGAYVLLRPRR